MKRAFDLIASGLALVLLSPVLVALALLVRVRIGSPVLFRQSRPGLGERPFTMIKFRTMREPRPGEDRALSDGDRLTALGRLLRRTSLDELPELWNVFRGDMSIVGPRPLLAQYLPFYTAEERARFTVRPGVTGLAQVNGRNTVSWSERLALDVEYVRTRSFTGDIRIIVETTAQVLRGSGVVTDARSVMLNLDEERSRGATSR